MVPSWIILALIFPSLTGIANIIGKINIDRYAPGGFTYGFWMGAQNFIIAPITLCIGIMLEGSDIWIISGGILTGVIAATAIIQYIFSFKIGQVSRVAPIFSMSPLVVAPLATIFLDESLSLAAILAIGMAVIGAALVSWNGGEGNKGHMFVNPVAPLLALSAAILLGIAAVLTKSFLDNSTFWVYLGAYRLGFGIAMVAITITTNEVRGGIRKTLRNRGFMTLVIFEEGILISVAIVVRFAAIKLGSIALVSAINAAHPAMVFMYSLILRQMFPDTFGNWITKGTLHTQAAGIAIITGAVTIICLN